MRKKQVFLRKKIIYIEYRLKSKKKGGRQKLKIKRKTALWKA